MRKVQEYRQNAEECRRLAKTMESKRAREDLLAVAAQWEKLAESRLELVQAYPDRIKP